MIARETQHENDSPLSPSTAVYDWNYLFTKLSIGLFGPPIELHIVRHAESVANARGLIAGQSDAELSVRGYIQALALGFRLRPKYDLAWVSGLGRTYRTIRVAESIRLRSISRGPICADARLNERSLGELEGAPRRRIAAYADGDLTYAPHRGESYLELAQRLLSFLVDLRLQMQREATAIVATHIGPMRLLVGILDGFDDPRSVLAQKFSNAQTYRCTLRELKWPAFIRREVLFELYGQQVGIACSAAYDQQV